MYGEGSYGEMAFGEAVGASAGFAFAGVSGSLAVIEIQDVFSATGTVPFISGVAIADDNVLVVVVELELAQL